MFYRVHDGGRKNGGRIGPYKPYVIGGNRCVMDIVYTGDVDAGDKGGMIYTKAFYFFHGKNFPFRICIAVI